MGGGRRCKVHEGGPNVKGGAKKACVEVMGGEVAGWKKHVTNAEVGKKGTGQPSY